MGIAGRVQFVYGDCHELIAGCRAVVVPSLYDTVGEAVLRAMALQRAVLCSRVRSLVELAGNAALVFDPHRPQDLVEQLERIEEQPGLLEDLSEQGRARIRNLDDAATVANQYVSVLREAGCQASFR
jgi:glycosyltransferase involved in cell wall biosynthesis